MTSVKAKHKLDESALRDALTYYPEVGMFLWTKTRSNSAVAGKRAGCVNPSTGYRQIRFNRTTISEHSLAWLFAYGEWPKSQLDHINRDKTDNRITNLREVTTGQNSQNKNSRGYTFDKNMQKWKAYISVDGVRYHLGYFEDKDEARKAYLDAKCLLHTGAYLNDSSTIDSINA